MDNQQMGEIRKALKEAHEHDLDADPMPWPGNANLQYWVGDHYDGIGAFVKYEDAYLAAHAPTWLRSLLEENTGNQQLLAMQKDVIQHLQQENERTSQERNEADARAIEWKAEAESLREELEQVKKERDKALAYPTEWAYEKACKALEKNSADAESLRSQLAAKDKELEWYGGGSEDGGEKARSILEQYARSAIVPNE